jgi:hypothetical protein
MKPPGTLKVCMGVQLSVLNLLLRNVVVAQLCGDVTRGGRGAGGGRVREEGMEEEEGLGKKD